MKKIFLYILIGLAFSSCQEERVLDFIDNTGGAVVIQALITNEDKTQFVLVSQTASYYDAGNQLGISGADVFLNGIRLTESNAADSVGYYLAPNTFSVNVGETVALEVNVDGKTYTAVQTMFPVPDIDTSFVSLNPFQEGFIESIPEDQIFYDVNLGYQEDLNRVDFYAYDLYLNGEFISESINDKFYTDDEFISESTIESIPVQQIFAGDNDVLDTNEVILVVRSISEETLKFYEDFGNQTEGSENPFFAPPPANTSTNITGGGFGFFEVSAVVQDTMIFIPSTLF